MEDFPCQDLQLREIQLALLIFPNGRIFKSLLNVFWVMINDKIEIIPATDQQKKI